MNVARLVSTAGADRTRRDRLGMSLAVSALVHVLVILIVAGLVKPFPVPQLSSLGATAPIEIAIVGVPEVVPAPSPEIPPHVVEPPVAPPLQLAVKPQVPPPSPPATAPVITPSPPLVPVIELPPLGVSAKSDPNADPVSTTAPPPPGDVTLGTPQNADRVGKAQAIRLAQRFPEKVSKSPRLRDALVVAYPPDAARTYTEARIAALVIVDTNGKILETTLYPDEPQFGPFIQNALRGARFAPAEIDAKPVPYWTILEFIFAMRRPVAPR